MALVNQSKPSTSYTNASKVSSGETWATITTTWASETRDWEEVSQLLTNTTKPAYGYLWVDYIYPWQLPLPWQTAAGITNQDKPV